MDYEDGCDYVMGGAGPDKTPGSRRSPASWLPKRR